VGPRGILAQCHQPNPDVYPSHAKGELGMTFNLALQLLLLRASESMGNHDSNIVGAGRVD
jgi:hypothetical protein